MLRPFPPILSLLSPVNDLTTFNEQSPLSLPNMTSVNAAHISAAAHLDAEHVKQERIDLNSIGEGESRLVHHRGSQLLMLCFFVYS